MAFSSPPETLTYGALDSALHPGGYVISQQVRALDVLRAAAARRPALTRCPAGDEFAEVFERFGRFDDNHPWLEPGDLRYAWGAHFDFVVQAPLHARAPLEPLLAVEFDGPSHRRPEAEVRDRAKNRLCAAAGLALVRVDQSLLFARERRSTVAWLAELWAAHEAEVPAMLAERDRQVAGALAAGADVKDLAEDPGFDVGFVFGLAHPFPAVRASAERLLARYGFKAPMVAGLGEGGGRWRATGWQSPLSSLSGGLSETWDMWVRLEGPKERSELVRARATVAQAYPLHAGPVVPRSWGEAEWWRLEHMPAGPFPGAAAYLGPALCTHNLLLEVEAFLARQRP